MSAHITDIMCYPLKGAGGFSLAQTALTTRGIRHDRRFGLAISESADTEFRTANKWQPWNFYHTLKKRADLVFLSAQVRDIEDDNTVLLRLKDNRCGDSVEGCPAENSERTTLEKFLCNALSTPAARLIDSQASPLWDDNEPLTLLNTASVEAFASTQNFPITTQRFRANIVFSGLPAWQEETLTGELSAGSARLKLGDGVPRCAATTVNPDTGERDAKVPQLLYRQRQHTNMGIFAKIIQDGEIAVDETLHFEPA